MISERADTTPRLNIRTFKALLPFKEGLVIRLNAPLHSKAVFRNNTLVIQGIPIKVLATPCHFGGHRYWWACPNCTKRVGTLYYRNENWGCRKCHNLTYSSQYETPIARHLSKAIATYQKMDAGTSGKPKGMHWKTYFRLANQCRDSVERVIQSFGMMETV